ncbi:hypothetical protein [Cuneatibacter caecimuris]|uniref:Uncharacterized protein n=1 Tax=Cuneatibacter caecimuris TaxID=1796618 RepID=A0A4Q7PJT6_9FIRM|nr:hypothetical protein [Cuneatibacter caecimuris]RZT00926.1 hypothetical protein EV209_1362 [Cuneatibacter caecimuris]
MTFKEKLEQEHPDRMDGEDAVGCPDNYGYETPEESIATCWELDCEACWNREIPETKRTAEAATPDGSET